MSSWWAAWVRELPGIQPNEKLVLSLIAGLVDTRGVAIVSNRYLIDKTLLKEREIKEIISLLRCKGLLQTSLFVPIRPAGVATRAYQRVQLIHFPLARSPNSLGSASSESRHLSKSINPTPSTDIPTADALRSLLRSALDSDWQGTSGWIIAQLLAEEGPQRFAAIIRRRKERKSTADPWDTISLAWEIVRTKTNYLVEAENPWGLLSTLLRQQCSKVDLGIREVRVESPILSRATHKMLVAASPKESQPTTLGIDDFTDTVIEVIEQLTEEGVGPEIAWAGTARIIEIAVEGKSRRHWLAARDPRLQSLGVDQKAARAWMTLMVGSRRGKAGAITRGQGKPRPGQAQLVAQLCNEPLSP